MFKLCPNDLFTKSSKNIALTLGEPGGIGADLFLQLASQEQSKKWLKECTVITDVNVLLHRAKKLNLPFLLNDHRFIHVDAENIDCCGKALPANAHYVIKAIDQAITGCLHHDFKAMVTGPVQKSSLNEAGIPFTGHTEYLAQKTKTPLTIMCFENNNVRLALATTHVPLKAVPNLITLNLLIRTIELLHKELQQKFTIPHPHILVCGLNPHAGEQGHIGKEEQTIIIPAIKTLQQQGIDCIGPIPADTILQRNNADCIVSLYHDQLLPAIKYQHFFDTVNITLGLPFIRTSVDHGTALDLAGTGKADPASLQCAIQTAIRYSYA